MEQSELIRTFALNQGTALKATRVPRARFLELPNILAPKRKLLTDEVEEVTLLAIFNTDTTHIQSYVDDEMVYEEVYFFHITLKKDTHLSELNQLLQQSITNPAVIFYTLEAKLAISTATKRLNKNALEQTMITESHLTQWLDESNPLTKQYLEAGAVTEASFMTLLRFYLDFVSYVRHAELLPFMNTLKLNRHRDWVSLENELKDYRKLQINLRVLREEERTHTSFGDKLSFRSKQVAQERQKNEATLNIQRLLETAG